MGIFSKPIQTVSRLPKGALILAFIAILSIILGFVREAIIASHFGTSEEIDTFLVALVIPKLLTVTLVQFSVAVILPVYIGYKQKSDEKSASKLAQKWFWFSAAANAGICLVLYFGANYFVHLLAPGFKEVQLRQSAYWLRTLLPYIWLLASAGTFKVILNSNDRFFVPAISNQIVSLSVIIGCIFFATTLGVGGLSAGFTVGGLLGFVWQYWLSKKFEPRLIFVSEIERTIALPIAAAGSMMLYYSAIQMDAVIDIIFASQLKPGSIAAYSFAQSINAIPSVMVTSVLSTALFPVLSRMAAGGNMAGAFENVVRWSIAAIVLVTLPVFLMIFFRHQVVSLVFERGAFDEAAVELTATALHVLPLRIPLSIVSVLFTFLLLAYKKHVIVSGAVVVFVSVKVLLSYFLVREYQLTGLALATVLAAALYSTILFAVSWKSLPRTSN